MKRLLSSAIAGAIVLAGTVGDVQGQARASRFDIGAYAGGAYTTSWLDLSRADQDDVVPGLSGAFGGLATLWFTPQFGIRAHGAYLPLTLPQEFATGIATPEADVNTILYDLSLAYRPFVARVGGGLFSSLYLFAGGGLVTPDYDEDELTCPPTPTVCLDNRQLDPFLTTVGQFTAGGGVDLFSLSDNIGIFGELATHAYTTPYQPSGGNVSINDDAREGIEEPTALTFRFVAGLKLALGDFLPMAAAVPVAPPPAPPAPPAAPAPAPAPPPPPADRAIQVCVIQDGQLQQVEATFRPATGDTMVMQAGAQRRFSEAYPATAGYAAGATWFINNQPITVANRRYEKFGLPRVIGPTELTRTGAHQGVSVFTETGAASPPEVIYLPVRPGCEFQPYQREQTVRGVRG